MRCLLIVVLLGACEGVIGNGPLDWTPPPVSVDDGEADFACSTDTPRDPPLRRLSRLQLENTVGEVMIRLVGEGAALGVLGDLESALAATPQDQRLAHNTQPGQKLFTRSDTSVGAVGVDANYRLGVAIGAALSTDARLQQMGFECAVDADVSNDDACIDQIIERVGRLTHRRPLDAETRAFFRDEVYGEAAPIERAALTDLLTVLFTQPYFLFHVEGEGELDPYEAASRLSYQFWNSMPDEALMDAAETGALMTSEGWSSQVERVVAHPRTRDTMRSFLLEWFRFDQMNRASTGAGPDFDVIAGDLNLDWTFDQAVENEIVDLFMHTLRSGGTFEDFFLSEVTTTTHPVLASIYGVQPSTGEPVALPAERHSILTRVGLLLTRAEVALPNINSITHPILRGVFVRRQIVCDDLPEAPGGAMDNLPPIDRTRMGSREATDVLTGSPACGGCHGRINGAGYALERFDPIGQLRDEEPLFDSDGNQTMVLAVNDRVDIREAPEGGLAGGAALAGALYNTGKVGACFARHYVRFSLGRSESVTDDGCLLRAVDEGIDGNMPLRELLSTVVLDPGFRVRAENAE
ncbi:MAG: DUF1592 domain-containing protein [Polyangiales bacterium]